MKPRLVILIVLAGGLAVYFATRASAPPTEEPEFKDDMSAEDRARIREQQKMLWERDLPGEEPPEPPDLSIQVEVDASGAKNRLFYYVTEANGYYVESFDIDFWYKPTPDIEFDDSPLAFSQPVNDYLPANAALEGCLEIVPAEIGRIDNHMGTSENWEAEITAYGRARMQNPDPLPDLAKATSCD